MQISQLKNKLNKRVLVATGAGVAASILLVFGITQCSSKNDAYDERDAVRAETEQVLSRANEVIDSLCTANAGLKRAQQDCNTVVSEQEGQIDALNDSIAALAASKDSIAALNDSLQNAARQLQETRKPRQQRQPQRQPRRDNTQPRRDDVQPRRDDVQPRQDVQNNPGANNAGVSVTVGNDNSGAVIVGDNNTVIVAKECASVNVAADTLKQHTVTITRQWIGTRRVK